MAFWVDSPKFSEENVASIIKVNFPPKRLALSEIEGSPDPPSHLKAITFCFLD
jgi:hypothetical protein